MAFFLFWLKRTRRGFLSCMIQEGREKTGQFAYEWFCVGDGEGKQVEQQHSDS